MKIFVFYNNQPCLDIVQYKTEGVNYMASYGLNRDRNPDRDWGELRRTRLTEAKEVELDERLKLILLEDLAFAFGNDSKKFRDKLYEFKLI